MANEHNTVSWGASLMELTNGTKQSIKSGTTTTDVSGRLVAGTMYYLYWTSNDPSMWHTQIASLWNTNPSSGKVRVATLTGAASGGKVQVKLASTAAMSGQDAINANQTVNQDSVTGTEVSSVGSVATTGLRLKMSTVGTGAAGSGSTGNFLRGYTANSVSDTTGKWLDIDGDTQSISIRSGAETDNLLGKFDAAGISFYDRTANGFILSGVNETGLKFYNGTATSASDATTIAHYAGYNASTGVGGIYFYNNSGAGAANILMRVHPQGGINFYDGTNGYLTMRMGYSNYMDLYDGTQAGPDGDRLAGIFGATISGAGATNTGSGFRFYNASGQGGSDANKTIEIVGNGNAGENGLYVLGNTTSAIGTGGDSLIKFERGTAYIGSSQSGSYDANKYGYLGARTIGSVDYLTLSSGATTNVLLHSPTAYAVKLTSDTITSGLEVKQVVDTSNNVVYCNLYPISAMNGSDSTLATRKAAPWVNIGYYPTASSGWNSRPVNSIQSYYFNAGWSGTYSSPTYSWDGDIDTGMYRTGENSIGFTAGNGLRTSIGTLGTYLYTISAENNTVVHIRSDGRLTKATSSRRYKDNIQDLDINTEKVYDLRPVSFDWKSTGKSDFGLIAEEVSDILPELVVYNEDSVPESVQYTSLSVLLLAELKKLREEVNNLKESL